MSRRRVKQPIKAKPDTLPAAPMGLELANFVPWLVSSLTRYLHGVMTEALAPLSISIAQWRVLLCVSDGEPYSLNAVVEFTQLDQSSLSRAIMKLEKLGMVSRARRAEDARIMSLRITVSGLEACQQATHAVQRACNTELEALSDEEREFFVRIIHKLLAELPLPRKKTGLSYL